MDADRPGVINSTKSGFPEPFPHSFNSGCSEPGTGNVVENAAAIAAELVNDAMALIRRLDAMRVEAENVLPFEDTGYEMRRTWYPLEGAKSELEDLLMSWQPRVKNLILGFKIAVQRNPMLTEFRIEALEEVSHGIHNMYLAFRQGYDRDIESQAKDFAKCVENLETAKSDFAERIEFAVIEHGRGASGAQSGTAGPAKRNKTQKRWTVPEIEEHIREALTCGDAETEKKYLFASADELESMIGCNRKTAMETKFWTEDRAVKQQLWRRENNTGKRVRKRDI